VTPRRRASRSRDSIIHDGKSTLTRRCSSAGRPGLTGDRTAIFSACAMPTSLTAAYDLGSLRSRMVRLSTKHRRHRRQMTDTTPEQQNIASGGARSAIKTSATGSGIPPSSQLASAGSRPGSRGILPPPGWCRTACSCTTRKRCLAMRRLRRRRTRTARSSSRGLGGRPADDCLRMVRSAGWYNQVWPGRSLGARLRW